MFAFGRQSIWAVFIGAIALLCEGAANKSGIFEVDVVFPRNGTYAPQALIPVVFAVQNLDLASTLCAQINWQLDKVDNSGRRYEQNGTFELTPRQGQSSEPYLAVAVIDSIYGVESTWEFSWWWTLAANMCYPPQANYFPFANTTFFTTSNSAAPADLIAATGIDVCQKTENFVVDIEGFSPGPFGMCANIGPMPTANPCAVTIKPTEVSSISAQMTTMACKNNQTLAHLNCTTNTSTSKALTSWNSLMASAAALSMVLTGLTSAVLL